MRKAWLRAFTVFFLGKAIQNSGSGLGLASLHNSGGLWGLGAVPGRWVPSPGLILGQGKYWLGVRHLLVSEDTEFNLTDGKFIAK